MKTTTVKLTVTAIFVVCAAGLAAGCTSAGPSTEQQEAALTHVEGLSLVAFMNDPGTTFEVLDVTCGLRSDSAKKLIRRRDGQDRVHQTADDQPFVSPEDIDSVTQVGPWTMEQLTACAEAGGFMPPPAVLLLLNFINDPDTDFETLDVECGLRSDAATNIIAHRDGPDALPGTADDNLIDDAGELDNISQVGSWTMGQLYLCSSSEPGGDPLPDGEACTAHTDCASELCAGLTLGPEGYCTDQSLAGTFENTTTVVIPDDDQPHGSHIMVAGLATVPVDVTVHINIDHPRKSDLIVELQQPGGGYELLWSREANPPSTIIAGYGIERDNMVNGVWSLIVTDALTGQVGTLHSWSLELTSRWD